MRYVGHCPKKERQTEVEELKLGVPISVENDPLISKERERSMADDQGINTRDLVKVFEVKDGKRKKTKNRSFSIGIV